MCLLGSIILGYSFIIANRTILMFIHHAAKLMILFSLQLFVSSVGTFLCTIR